MKIIIDLYLFYHRLVKYMKKAIVQRLRRFLEDFNLLSDNQFEFRNNKSYEKAIMKFRLQIKFTVIWKENGMWQAY